MRWGFAFAGAGVFAAVALSGVGCDSQACLPIDGGDLGLAYSIAVLPDTQYYASSWPDVFEAQTQWIVANHEAQQIAFVLHTGDIVDADVPEQWQVAAHALHEFDDQVPYVVTSGNHDYVNIADRMGMGNTYFPPADFARFPWFHGTFELDHIENSFSLFPVPDGQWLVIALEFGPRDEVLAWANNLLATFADTRAIIITHAYLFHDGSRYDHVGSPGQNFNPHEYVMMGQPGSSINDGEEIWTKLIAPNSNVKFVFSGHDVNGQGLPPGTAARLTSVRADGTYVHQILANYQTCTAPPCAAVHGGNGYLRLLRFPSAGGRVTVETYSPYLGANLTDPENRFDVDMD